jgi:hypothetical protein
MPASLGRVCSDVGAMGGTAVWAARHSGRGHAISYLRPVAPWALVTPVRAGLQTRQRRWGEVQAQRQRQRAV